MTVIFSCRIKNYMLKYRTKIFTKRIKEKYKRLMRHKMMKSLC